MVTVNLPAYAAALGAAKGAGFDVDKIAEEIVKVFLGQKKATDIPAEIVKEMADIWINFGKDPIGTSMDVAVGATVPTMMFAGLGYMLTMFGLPTKRRFGSMTLVWAISPPTKRRSRKKKRATYRRAPKTKVVYRYRKSKKGGK